MMKKCGSGGGQSIQLSIRRREIFEVAPASGGFNAASRRIALVLVVNQLIEKLAAKHVCQRFRA
jgi:hypothetical protein